MILAVTEPPDRRIVLIEQQRPPFGKPVIELPAGLVEDNEEETFESAVRRELREEAGFDCREVVLLCEGSTSPGLTNERSSLYLAAGLSRIDSPDGDLRHDDGSVTHRATRGLASEGESIVVHEVPLGSAMCWLKRQQESGKVIDLRVYAGLAFVPGYSLHSPQDRKSLPPHSV